MLTQSQVANDLSNLVNSSVFNKTDFAELMLRDHRTLIQSKFALFLKFAELLNKQYVNGDYDLRNEYACKLASRICEAIDVYERDCPKI